MTHEQAVLRWIADTYDLDAIKIEAWPLFPAGTIIIDEKGVESIVYYDLVTDSIKWSRLDSTVLNKPACPLS